MNIDLSKQNIKELRFDDAHHRNPGVDATADANAAKAVTVLNLSSNLITRIVGLGDTFSRLTELRLSHNALGVSSTPPYIARQHAQHTVAMAARRGWSNASLQEQLCDGEVEWLSALPRTLEVLDLSYNHLNSFVTCTCGQIGGHSEVAASSSTPPSAPTGVVRYLRHACPLTLSLFFPRSRFPALRRLDLSHNALSTGLRESDEMEESWQRCFEEEEEGVSPVHAVQPCAAEEVDLSFNPAVASVNCFLLHSVTEAGSPDLPPGQGLRTLHLAECGVEDLIGLSGVSLYAPRLTELQLHPTPLSLAITRASPSVLADFLESLVLPTLANRTGQNAAGQGASPLTVEQRAVAKALKDLSTHHLPDLDEDLRNSLRREKASAERHPMGVAQGSLSALSLCVYASLLLEVIPCLETLDGCLDTHWCRHANMAAVQSALLKRSASGSRRTPSAADFTESAPRGGSAPPQPLRRQPSLSVLAAAVTPQLRPRVVVQDDADWVAEANGTAVAGAVEEEEEEDAALPRPAEVDTRRGLSTVPRPNRFQAALDALKPLVRASSDAAESQQSGSHLVDESVETTEGTAIVAPPTAVDWFTPAKVTLNPEAKARYEALCAEAKRLEEDLLKANERREHLAATIANLKAQLTDDRRLIADQRRECTRLRTQRSVLRERVEAQRAKLKKKQKEIAYGIRAMRSQVAAARERARVKQLEEREKAVERKEREWQRRLTKADALSVHYNHTSEARPLAERAEAKPNRSVILRAAATRKRLEQLESKEPLAYSPSRFHKPQAATQKEHSKRSEPSPLPGAPSSGHRGSSLQTMLDDDEEDYFRSYHQKKSEEGGGHADADAGAGAGGLPQLAAETYCSALSPVQRQQLQEALSASGRSSPFGGGSQPGSRTSSPTHSLRFPPARKADTHAAAGLKPPPPFPSASSSLAAAVTAIGDEKHEPPPSPVNDLSALSLTELFEVAASIRNRQLALQQLQEEWQERKRASASSSSLSPRHKASPPLGISPVTPPPTVAPPQDGSQAADRLAESTRRDAFNEGAPPPSPKDSSSDSPSSVPVVGEDGCDSRLEEASQGLQTAEAKADASRAAPDDDSTQIITSLCEAPATSRALFS